MTTPGQDGGPDQGPAAAPPRSRVQSRPILVVDDDGLVLAVVARVLRAHGYEVLTASNGREALRAVYGQAPSPALLITDVDMPGMTGIELAARLTADRPTVAVVLMSGDPSVREGARERPEMVRTVLVKPFEVEELLAVVADVLGGPAEDDQGGGR